MNILFLTRGYPSDKYVTHGIFEYDMAKGLVKAGHQVTYLAVDSRSIRRWRKWGYESFNRDGVHIEAINLPIGRVYNPIKTKLSEIALIKRFQDIHKTHGPFDVIHAHFIESAYLGAKLKDYAKVPLLVTEHSSRLNGKLDDYTKNKLSYAYSRANIVTSVSKSLAETIYEKFQINSQIVPNIVDTETFKFKSEDQAKSKTFDFISAGNLIPGKGMDITIEAFSKILHKHPTSNLFIFGKGSEKENLIKLVKEKGISQNVHFCGLVKREELRHYYSKCRVFVLASYSETFGVAYIEALAMGLPVIATNCGGPSEFVTKENGIMVPVGDVESLYHAMLKIIENYESFQLESISQSIIEKYSQGNNAKILEKIYREILTEKHT